MTQIAAAHRRDAPITATATATMQVVARGPAQIGDPR